MGKQSSKFEPKSYGTFQKRKNPKRGKIRKRKMSENVSRAKNIKNVFANKNVKNVFASEKLENGDKNELFDTFFKDVMPRQQKSAKFNSGKL